MFSKSWLIIRDDARMTFEVCGQDSNPDPFMNNVHGMQKAGMSVSGLTPPVTNQSASKEVIKVVGYAKELGLHKRLLDAYKEKTRKDFGAWED